MLRQEHSGYIYIWSREGAGRSHLLHAACAELSARGDAVGYVPLDKRTWFVPEVLEGMEHLSLVCIDNIECVAGDEPWEMAMFNLYNRILESGKTRLLITGDRNQELLGRYEENAYFWRMMRIVGHPDVRLLEFDGYDHGNMPEAGHPVALRYIRDHAAEYGVDPSRVGIMGFSAGGHLATMLLAWLRTLRPRR